MSRSNPNTNAPHPAVYWFEWNGTDGNFRYWDKELNEGEGGRVEVPNGFSFILLDQTASVTGYSEKLEKGIFSNEVRDTRTERFTVKVHKSNQTLAEGIYSDIKERIQVNGGKFTANCYVAFKHNKKLMIGVVQMRGASITPWFEFVKENRKGIYEKAIIVKSTTQEKKGRNEYLAPVFELLEISEATNKEAIALDGQVQEFLKSYFQRRQVDKVSSPSEQAQPDAKDDKGRQPDSVGGEPLEGDGPPESDDVPF